MFLTLNDFLIHFPLMNISKKEFVSKFTVTYATPQSLADIFALKNGHGGRPIIKKPETDKRYINRDAVIDYFYEIIITNRHKYLTLFYQAYFEFKDPLTLKWSGTSIISTNENFEPYKVISLQKNDASKRLIRNLFYLELLDLTKVTNTVKSQVSFWTSLSNMYNKLQLEDRFFAPSSIDLFLRAKGKAKADGDDVTEIKLRASSSDINYNNLFYLFQAYQPKASIFNPYSIKWILTDIIDKELGYSGKALFTPVLSWASYLMAFMHTDYKEYVGVDVMPTVCDKAEFLSKWYEQKHPLTFKDKKTRILCQPSETLIDDAKFMKQYKEHFDVILVCPPYYDMEIYHEGPQSIDLYPNYDEWLKIYWGKTVEMCAKITKKGGIFALIGNDYQSLDGELFPLTKDLDKIVKRYYKESTMYYLQNRTSPLRVNAKDRTERLFIYKKI